MMAYRVPDYVLAYEAFPVRDGLSIRIWCIPMVVFLWSHCVIESAVCLRMVFPTPDYVLESEAFLVMMGLSNRIWCISRRSFKGDYVIEADVFSRIALRVGDYVLASDVFLLGFWSIRIWGISMGFARAHYVFTGWCILDDGLSGFGLRLGGWCISWGRVKN